MKKTISILLIAAVILTLGLVSCKKDKKEEQKTYYELVIGRWRTHDGGHYEVYYAGGTGKMWDPGEDVQEDEADTFDWSIDESNKKMTQIIHFQGGQGDIPQYCNIITLDESTFTYNNDGWRSAITLVKVF
ncbi:MAG: hypothetical protein II662_00755 [Bacteroidales bacterium]|nr:hypothetical protein [Bacteroidales bacterium]